MKHLSIIWAMAGILLWILAPTVNGAPTLRTNLYYTGFEPHEGYRVDDLNGQNGWFHLGFIGEDYFEGLYDAFVTSDSFFGEGQQAVIGGSQPTNQVADGTITGHPIILNPVPTETPLIHFSVLFEIVPSSEGFNQDWFRWSVYNAALAELFSIEFDTLDNSIAYLLDSGELTKINGAAFAYEDQHRLELVMNFSANQWSALFNGIEIVSNQPITTAGSALTLGEVSALWITTDPNEPGDNYMIFDDYTVWAESVPEPVQPPQLLTLGRTEEGYYALRLEGTPDCRYVIDYSENSNTWTPIRTNIAVHGIFDFIDTNAPVTPQRIFRARLLE